MSRLLKFAVVALGVTAATDAFGSSTVCGDTELLVQVLDGRDQERQRSMGMTAKGELLELYVAGDGAWSILMTGLDGGGACIVADGAAGKRFPTRGRPSPRLSGVRLGSALTRRSSYSGCFFIQAAMKGQIGTTWRPSARAASSTWRARREPTPLPPSAFGTSVWMKVTTPGFAAIADIGGDAVDLEFVAVEDGVVVDVRVHGVLRLKSIGRRRAIGVMS